MAALEILDGAAVRRWCELATKALGAVREQIDALNVFPVADSDTGTNLHMTMVAAAKAIDELPEAADQGEIWQALARGVLLGAQGNSGVIVSQYLRGLAEVCGPASPCDGGVVTRALGQAARLSHAAVGEPVEGTVLTVASAAARSAAAAGDPAALAEVAVAAAEGAREALARTTAQLDVLARSGVVDAGAAGLCVLTDTFAAVVTGAHPEWLPIPRPAFAAQVGGQMPAHGGNDGGGQASSASYEVMYLLEAADEPVAQLRERLAALGDSLVVVGGEGLWNVHIHASDPGAAIEAGIDVGRPYRIRVTYLGLPGSKDGPGQAGPGHAVVAIARGEGLAGLFADAGAVVVHPDHGRVPEHADLLSALRRAADGEHQVAVLPGDPAVVALAENAAAQARDEGILVRVLPAQTAVQSLSALAAHDPAASFDDDAAAMEGSALSTRWGLVKPAAHGQAAGGFAGFVGETAVTSGTDAAAVAGEVADRLLAAGGDLVTLLAGETHVGRQGAGAPSGGQVADLVAAHLYATRPDVEVFTHDGGESAYLLLIGVEQAANDQDTDT